MRLDSSKRKLQVLLSGAVASTQPKVEVYFTDWTNQLQSDKPVQSKFSTLNGVTPVDVCDAPPKDSIREIDEFVLYNSDSASVTAIVRINDNGTVYQVRKVAVAAGYHLQFRFGRWRVLDASGNETR